MEEVFVQQAAPFWSYLPAIITAIGTIVMGWFSYNQYTKNKMTDRKIELWKADEEKKSAKRSEDLAKIFGELWSILRATHADRVYIIQPHPLTNHEYISISLEVRDNGISSMRPVLNRISMDTLPKFCAELATSDTLCYDDVKSQMEDEHMRSILSANGTDMLFIKRISTPNDGWIGSIVIDFTHSQTLQPETYQFITESAADTIRYILPEYK